jgi:ATP-binding cassette subfamily B protein
VAQRRWWFVAILLLEAANSACNITIPLALSRITKAVTRAPGHSLVLVDALTAPPLLFLGLGLGEALFGGASRNLRLRIGPKQRQELSREASRVVAARWSSGKVRHLHTCWRGVLETGWFS